jgi:hypothetical protein
MLKFADSFGKKQNDLIKKEFEKGKGAEYKLKSKTSDGVEFEGVVDKIGNSELNLNFKDSDMNVKNRLDQDGVFTVESTMFKVADNLDATIKFKTPKCDSDAQAFFQEMSVGAEYATAELYSALTLKAKFKDEMKPESFTGDLEVVAKVMDDINAGLKMSKIKQDGSSELDFAVINAGKDYQIAAHFLASTAGTTPLAKEMTATFWQQTSSDLAVAAAFSCTGADAAAKDMVGITLATDYKLSASANIKTKIGWKKNSEPTVNLAWVQKFENVKLAVSHNHTTKAFGCDLTINC